MSIQPSLFVIENFSPTVFAGHLSIFTLTIITVERWFAITHAIYLNKRLKFKTTVLIMIGGWIYSFCMAAMPLFGVSNYSSTRWARVKLKILKLVFFLRLNNTYPTFFTASVCRWKQSTLSISLIWLRYLRLTVSAFSSCVSATRKSTSRFQTKQERRAHRAVKWQSQKSSLYL